MRLFHISENDSIVEFEPRIPERDDLNKSVGLVWAVDEFHLPNFLTPRNCPRVTYHIGKNTADNDREHFFSSASMSYAIVLENKWFDIINSTVLYAYEFSPDGFILQDKTAGYYVAETKQVPVAKYEITDIFAELIKRNVEIRLADNLWDIADKIEKSTLNFSFCRMAFAQPRIKPPV